MTDKKKPSSISAMHSSYAWLFLFLPSLFYYLHRLSSIQFFHHSYPTLTDKMVLPPPPLAPGHVQALHDLFYISKKPSASSLLSDGMLEFTHPVVTLETDFHSLSGVSYVHDDALGRGYILLSDSSSDGRIWRWEIGGGPIAIGKSLHMERSGCRSRRFECKNGGYKGSAAMEVLDGATSEDNQFIISELGEGRLIRMEENGARTPLLVNVTVADMVFLPPFGDGIVVMKEGVLRRGRELLNRVKKISAKESKDAHNVDYWVGREHDLVKLEDLWTGGMEHVAGVELLDWDYVFVTGEIAGKGVVMKVFVGEEEEEDDDDSDDSDDSDDEDTLEMGSKEDKEQPKDTKSKTTLFFDASPYLNPLDSPKMGGIVMDSKGNVYVAVAHHGIMIISPEAKYLGTIPFPKEEDVRNLIFGKDGYLYIISKTTLFRIKIRVGKSVNLQSFQKMR